MADQQPTPPADIKAWIDRHFDEEEAGDFLTEVLRYTTGAADDETEDE